MPSQRFEATDRWLADFARNRVHDGRSCIDLTTLSKGVCLGTSDNELAERSVLLATQSQIVSAAAMVELDGLVRRLVLAPPGLSDEHLQNVVTDAEVDSVVTDYAPRFGECPPPSVLSIHLPIVTRAAQRHRTVDTQWVLLTSGTSGRPKMVIHSLGSLVGAIPRNSDVSAPQVWSTFYDIRRYGGLQIFLRALLGGADLVLTDPNLTCRRTIDSPRRGGRHINLGHAFTLATGVDECAKRRLCAILYSPLRRDRRSNGA